MKGMWLVFSLGSAPLSIDRWVGGDKLQHFFTSAFVQSMSYGTLRAAGVEHGPSLAGATATSLLVGIGKEVRDSRVKGEFSRRDLVWDAAGVGVASVLLVRTRR